MGKFLYMKVAKFNPIICIGHTYVGTLNNSEVMNLVKISEICIKDYPNFLTLLVLEGS